ncbi:MAG: hypothetical protein JW751_27025 [Polyangiaceae bacterium]|nr:hypothetical protein [Polyangiaceae bacterium]
MVLRSEPTLRRESPAVLIAAALAAAAAACSNSGPLPHSTPSGGATSEGTSAGPSGATGGDAPSGGTVPSGGTTPVGGQDSGGNVGVGGEAVGGMGPGGGTPTSGGTMGSGGFVETGGTGGLVDTGGAGGGGPTGGTGGNAGGTGGAAGAQESGSNGGATAAGATAGGAAGAEATAGSPNGGTGGEPVPVCPAPACGNTTQENRVCNHGDEIHLGKYRILNNLWGGQDASPPEGQCSHSFCSGSAIAWGTEFTWTSGDPISVKAFAAAILGWHWSGIDPSSGLPVELSAQHDIPCSWSFKVDIDPEGSLNVAYDLWVHTTGNADSVTTPSDEVMVWEYAYQKDDPIGTFVATTTVGGVDWDLYEGSNGGNQVHSFLRKNYTTCDDVNLRDFLDDLVVRGSLDESQYLISIEAGPEVVMGTGSVNTEYFSCNVE